MNKFLISLFIFSTFLWATYLEVDDSPIGAVSKSFKIKQISQKFPLNTLKVGTKTASLNIPIYIKSNSRKQIFMTVFELGNLKNSKNEEISTSIFYRELGRDENQVYSDKAFVLSSKAKGKRKDSTLVGYLVVKTNNLSSLQTMGEYSLLANIQVSTRKERSNISSLSIKGFVPLVAIAGFDDLQAYQTGQYFKDAKVAYGSIDFDKEHLIVKDLFVKNNSNKSFKISLSTSNLIHQVHKEHQIGMNYYYVSNDGVEQKLNKSKAFLATFGKSEGAKIGAIKFKTERISSKILSGKYKAVLNVTISLE